MTRGTGSSKNPRRDGARSQQRPTGGGRSGGKNVNGKAGGPKGAGSKSKGGPKSAGAKNAGAKGAGPRNTGGQGRPAAQGRPGPQGERKANSARGGKPAASGSAKAPNAAPRGPKAFADERYGLDLGPVRRRRRGPSKRVTATPRVQNPDGERLQKVMAHAGVASRRVCEEMIETGRVEVNGQIVRELGVRVKPDADTVHVDGVRLQLDESLVYFAFNKPSGVVTSMKDPDGRPDISDYLREGQSERLYHVGRLDQETEGLLLLTNDGELAHRLTHPSFEVPKTYLVQVRGPMPHGVGKQLREGVKLEDGWSKVDSFKLVDSTPGKVLVEVVLHSGKNRIVRRMFDEVGFPVLRLVRLQVGPIRLGDQRQGSLRKLGKQEVGHLLAEVGL